MVDMDHEIALMYASTPFGIFQPRIAPYSPFEDVILRVVSPRPRIEDLVLQLLGSIGSNSIEHETTQDSQKQDETAIPADSTPDFDISERLARAMQEQEDREQEMRDRSEALSHQMGEFMSSMFGGSYGAGGSVSPAPQQNVNAEAGPSTIKPRPSFPSANRSAGPSFEDFTSMAEADRVVFDESSKSAGKQRARQSPTCIPAPDSNTMDLLDSAEAALRHEINRFDFPEHLDFLGSAGTLDESLPSRTPPTPTLAHTTNNAPVHAHERALSNLLASLSAVANDAEEEVRMRRLQLVERVKREMENLDRRVLELWAAGRRYIPMHVDGDA